MLIICLSLSESFVVSHLGCPISQPLENAYPQSSTLWLERLSYRSFAAMEGLENPLDGVKKEKGFRTLSDLAGLALKWDDSSVVRQRMRDHLNLVVHYDTKTKKETNFDVERTLRNAKANSAPLTPLCHLIRSTRMVPNIDKLAGEVAKVYVMNNQSITSKLAMSQAWSLRYLIGVIRNSIRTDKKDKTKKILPKDPGS